MRESSSTSTSIGVEATSGVPIELLCKNVSCERSRRLSTSRENDASILATPDTTDQVSEASNQGVSGSRASSGSPCPIQIQSQQPFSTTGYVRTASLVGIRSCPGTATQSP